MAGGLLNHSKKSGQNKLVHSGPVKVEIRLNVAM